MKEHVRNVSFAFLSGILGSLAFPPFELTFLGWVCLIPFLLFIKGDRPKENFLYAYLTGVVFFGLLTYWLVNVTIPGMIILVLILSVFYGLFGLIAGYAFKYSMNLLILPFVWVVLEFIRGNIFTGFPWGLLGYSQYTNINLIQIADITGVYGVSFLIVVFNVAMLGVFKRSKRKIAHMMIALLFILVSTSYGIYRQQNMKDWGSAKISVVQGNVPQNLKWDPAFAKEIVKEYTGLTKEAALDKPDIIIWPETAYPYLFTKGGGEAEEVNALSKKLGIPILAGVVSLEGDDYYNSAVLFNGKSEISAKYDKLHLVPFGEYVPFKKSLSFLRKYIDKPIGDFEKGSSYTLFPVTSARSSTGSDGALMRTTNFFKFGALICFEDAFPYISREFVKKGAGFLVNMTNDAWFGETAAPRQHMQASVFRAVENRVPVVRAANTGISCFIDYTGNIISRVRKGQQDIFIGGFATDEIKVSRVRTYYTVYGDVFVYFCAFMVILLMITEGLYIKNEKKKQG
ncbi:apolipoprotein N-acyltransferase [Candidatus Omnitrophota bacterium]